MKILRRIFQFVKKYWYWFIIVAAIIAGVLVGLMIGRPRQGKRAVADFVNKAKWRIYRVDCDTMHAKAKVKAKTLEQKTELAVISRQPNVRERRKALAKFLEGL